MSYHGRSGHGYGNSKRHSRSMGFQTTLGKSGKPKTLDSWSTNRQGTVSVVEKKPDVDPLTDPRFEVKKLKEMEFWYAINPMQRYQIMNEVGKIHPSDRHSLAAIFNYIKTNDLATKHADWVKAKPQVVETKTAPILVQPEIVKTNSIPEVIAQGAPSKAKTYATNGQSFEVLEADYINHRFEKEKSRVRANINYYNSQIKEISQDPNMRDFVKKRKIDDIENSIKVQNKWLEMMNNPKPENKASNEHYYRKEYIQLIKDSIKHGKPVPEEVIKQRPEFQVAQDARRRYEKGLHTSFANKSAAVNAVMFLEKGYKVKRQDGKEITDRQIQEIGQGITDIQKAVGPTKDIMEKADLTIAHTSGTYPFLMVAGGVYHPNDKTITMGIFGLKSLAHEWAHWLDYEGGKASSKGYEYYTDGKKSKRIDSRREALSRAEEYSNKLYNDAAWNMNDRHGLREVYKRAYSKSKQVTAEEKKAAREVVARVGGYWGDPREVWARLVEQYVAITHGKKTEAAESPEYYYKHPAYWSKEKFAEYQPIVKAELERRISIARGS